EMCGNAARCVARFAFMKGIAGQEMSWETNAGIISADVHDDIVKVKLRGPSPVEAEIAIDAKGQNFIVDTMDNGVPDAVVFVDDLNNCNVNHDGARIRYHERSSPSGTNTDFAFVIDRHNITVRTSERGVEDETLACATGMAAPTITAPQGD